MKSATDKLTALRAEIEKNTAHALICVRRNEFIGTPVNSFEWKIRRFREASIRRNMKKAIAALGQFEKVCLESVA